MRRRAARHPRFPILRATALALGLCAGAGRATPAQTPAPPTRTPIPPSFARAVSPDDTARALQLLRRATYGVRPADLAHVLAVGPEQWLERQLHPRRIEDPAAQRIRERYPAATMSPGELLRAYPPPRVLLGRERSDSLTAERRRERTGRSPRRILADLVGAKLERAVASERQLEEVMVAFWFDHFNVFFAKGQVRWLVGDYERTAIRPRVFGRFEDMLVAVASHPAMLVYLDNWTSAVPDSMNPRLAEIERRARERRRPRASRMRPGADTDSAATAPERRRRAHRPRGLNENYARELLELHTLGVDGGYTQHDVVEVARAFTGWTIERSSLRPRGGGMDRRMEPPVDARSAEAPEIAFAFRPIMHDTGEKTVLGHRLPAGRGIEDGLDVLRILAGHPSTARHIATKLARHFVADDPPASLVDRLSRTFLETDGDLRAVTRALFTAPEFYDPAYRGSQVKRPFELVASTLRTAGAPDPDLAGDRRRDGAGRDAPGVERDTPGTGRDAPGTGRGERGMRDDADRDAPATARRRTAGRPLVQTLRTFGHLPYMQSAPTGYPTVTDEWVGGAAMLDRMNFALSFAAGRAGAPPDQAILETARRAGSRAELVAYLAGTLLPGTDTAELEAIVLADLEAQPTADPATLAARALGLLLASPEFQRR